MKISVKNYKKINKSIKHNKKKRNFTKKHYNSGDGMLTSVWGPSMWHYLHIISFNYPLEPTKQEKNKFKMFINSLQYTLPCKYCRINLKNNLKKYPLTDEIFINRNTFSRYIYNLHELVNRLLGKKSNLTYCEVRELYEHFRARCTKNKPKMFKFNKTKKIKEKGCTEPLYGSKSRCLLKIVPAEKKAPSLHIDKKCIKIRG